MKLLFINTKVGDVEYKDYWGRNANNNYELIPKNNYLLFLIKRKSLEVNGNELDIDHKEYGKGLEKIIKTELEAQSLSMVNVEEIGIISHADLRANVSNFSKQFQSMIIFNRTYGSQDKPPGLMMKDFGATKCASTLPLDKLRDAVCNCENSNFDKAFEEVWNFFLGDPVLEAKLELLHRLLVPPKNLKTIEDDKDEWRKQLMLCQKDQDGEVHIQHWTEFINGFDQVDKSNPLGDEYVNLLAQLRDSLLKK